MVNQTKSQDVWLCMVYTKLGFLKIDLLAPVQLLILSIMNQKLCKNIANSRIAAHNKFAIFCDRGYVIRRKKLRQYSNSRHEGP